MIPRHPWGGLADPASKSPADLLILGPAVGRWRLLAGRASETPRPARHLEHSPPSPRPGRVVTPDLLRIEDLGDVEPETGGVATGGSAAGGGPVDDAARRAYFDRVQRLVTERLGRQAPGGGPHFS